MRRGFSLLAMVAVLAQGPAMAGSAERIQQQGNSGLCRTPAPLPQLGAESNPPQQQRNDGDRRRRPGPDVMPPPAAAPASSSDGAAESEGVIVTGTTVSVPVGKVAASRDEAPRFGIRPPHPRPPRPQSGILTAGEHDDLLNPELYANYVRQSNLGQAIPDLPTLDTARVLTVAVHDRAGRPVPFAMVELACADGNSLRLATTADGTVSFFPDVDRLGRTVRVRTAGEEWRSLNIPAKRGGQRVDFTVDRTAPAVRKLDLMLAIDTTGSMGDEIRYLQTELAAIIDGLRARHQGLDIRLGFVFYKDLGDEYVTNTVPLSGDIAAGQAVLRQRYAGGGGDYPEALEQALIRAAGQAWRADAAKTMLLVADAPPHDENFGKAWLAAEHLRAKRVHIVPVAASGVADKAEYAMRAMAAATQSRYTFLTDDSGVGNPHAAPAIDCYQVTRLDALLRRVIDSQISGRRIEPDKADVIRTVGKYDNGRCIIPREFGND